MDSCAWTCDLCSYVVALCYCLHIFCVLVCKFESPNNGASLVIVVLSLSLVCLGGCWYDSMKKSAVHPATCRC